MRKLGCYALVYVYDGAGSYRDGQGQKRVRSGDLLLLFPDVPHAYGPGERECWNELFLLFEGEAFELWRVKGILRPERPILHLQPIEAWIQRFHDLYRDAATPLQQLCSLQGFLSDALAQDHYVREADEARVWVEEANALLRKWLLDPQPVRKAAEAMGVSYESFRKIYKQRTGIPPGRYGTEQRMRLAARRMIETDLPLCQVAEALGFCDEYHFSRRFKEVTGLTPGAYRKRLPRLP